MFQQECVWMNGPVAAGEMHDSTLFRGGTKDVPKDRWDRSSLYFKLPAGKKAVADSAYKVASDKVTTVAKSQESIDFINRAKARQETYHSRLRSFGVLNIPFRHGKSTEARMSTHKMCAEAVSVIVQYDLKYHPLMEM